jgi:hypothetical protein
MMFYDVPMNRSVSTEDSRGLTSYSLSVTTTKVGASYSRLCTSISKKSSTISLSTTASQPHNPRYQFTKLRKQTSAPHCNRTPWTLVLSTSSPAPRTSSDLLQALTSSNGALNTPSASTASLRTTSLVTVARRPTLTKSGVTAPTLTSSTLHCFHCLAH